MQSPRPYHNIALVGFMGVGKSTVGQILAGMLDFEFVDTDRVIETREGRRISEIFAQEGETRFRDLETNLIREYETQQGLILSTGGGLVVRPENLASLRTHALIVCLWASPAVIYERVRYQGHRPSCKPRTHRPASPSCWNNGNRPTSRPIFWWGSISAIRRRRLSTSPTASDCCATRRIEAHHPRLSQSHTGERFRCQRPAATLKARGIVPITHPDSFQVRSSGRIEGAGRHYPMLAGPG